MSGLDEKFHKKTKNSVEDGAQVEGEDQLTQSESTKDCSQEIENQPTMSKIQQVNEKSTKEIISKLDYSELQIVNSELKNSEFDDFQTFKEKEDESLKVLRDKLRCEIEKLNKPHDDESTSKDGSPVFDTDSGLTQCDSTADYSDIVNEYKNKVFDYSFLLISAPENEKAYEERKLQFQNFCRKLWPVDTEKMADEMCLFRVVTTRDEIKKALYEFGNKAKLSLKAMIILNGHGSEDGFIVSNDNPVALNEILIDVKHYFETIDYIHPIYLPARVELVFAQCYAHSYTDLENSRFKVISFTDSEVPVSYQFIGNEGKYSRHLQLEALAMSIKLQLN